MLASVILFNVVIEKQGASTKGLLPRLQAKSCGYVADFPGQTLACYWFFPADTEIKLPVAVFSKKPSAGQQEALIYIAGGPGDGDQNSVDNIEYWSYWYQSSGIDRDLIVFTPRGTFGSHPYWNCLKYDITSMDLMAQNLSFEEETSVAFEVLTACLTEFNHWLHAHTHAGLEQFSTQQQADDVIALVNAFSYERWHLWGVSYGSRVALKVAERAGVSGIAPASLLLDSVYPYTEGRQSDWAARQEEAIALHGQYFAERLGLAQSFLAVWEHANTQLGQQIKEAVDAPIFTLENWYKKLSTPTYGTLQSGYRSLYGPQAQPFLFYMNEHRLLALMFFVLYDPNLLDDFYQALLLLESGNPQWRQPMGKVLTAFVNSSFDPSFSSMVFFATECSDNVRETETDYQRALKHFQKWREYLRIMRTNDVCKLSLFQSQGIGSEPRNLPNTFMLGGQRDHVTPSGWAEALASRMASKGSAVRFYRVPKAGHSVIFGGWCSTDIINAWLDTSPGEPREFEPAQYCVGE